MFSKNIRRKNVNLSRLSALALAAAALGALNTEAYLAESERHAEMMLGEHEIYAYVLSVESKQNFMTEHIIRVESLDGEPVEVTAVFVTDFSSELMRGDAFSCRVTVSRFSEYEDAEYLRCGDAHQYPVVCLLSSASEIADLGVTDTPRLALASLNSKLSATLRARLGKYAGSLASALLLGNRHLLYDDVLRDFKRAGIYHMLALSGLHVAILIGIVDRLLALIRTPRGARMLICLALCFFYVALTGFLLSACRAMLMLAVAYLAFWLRRRADTMTALFFGVSLIVLISPVSVLDLGLLLSFLSTLGIVCATLIKDKIGYFERIKNASRVADRLRNALKSLVFALLSSWCVFVATLPVVAYYFGEVSLATFFSNLFMGSICEIFMIVSLAALALPFSSAVCGIAIRLACAIGEAMTDIAAAISAIDGIMLSLRYPLAGIIVSLLFVSSVILLAVRLKRRWLTILPSIFAVVAICISASVFQYSRSDSVSAEFVLGDALVLSSSDGVYICDASNGRGGAFYSAIEIAREGCFTEIDGVVLTHYHNQHVISMQRLADRYMIRSVYVPMPQNEYEGLVMSAMVRTMTEERGIPVYIYEPNEPIDLLGGELVVSNRFFISGKANPGYAMSYSHADDRVTLAEPLYFGTYFEESHAFDSYIDESDILIFGSDGGSYSESFEIFGRLSRECEVYFADHATFALSDWEKYIDDMTIYFNTVYKKYELK